MPAKSKAQLRWINSPSGKKALGAKGVKEWDNASKGLKLPEKVKAKKKKSTGKELLKKAVGQLNAPKSSYNKSMNGTSKLSQRDAYAQAMNKAQSRGGSNGIGVGYKK